MEPRTWQAPHEAAVTQPRVALPLPPLDELLTAGGDTRLHLEPTSRLNGYGCRPFPRPEAFTFASSTATSISGRGYAAAGALHQALLERAAMSADRTFGEAVESVRDALAALLDLGGTAHAIVLSPSGTDSELHAVFVARSALPGPLTCVIAGSDETGSGTALAARACHFNTMTSQGVGAVKGEPIAGMAEGVTGVGIPLRDADGASRAMAAIDGDVQRAVADALARGDGVLVHVMDHSKLGWRCPSIECLDTITRNSPERVLVVVDACQMRLSRRWIRTYLDHGYLVQITGSKFFTGPPFSGALLVPAPLAERMRTVRAVPAGLRAYAAATDWPREWAGIRRALPSATNVGQLLRWTAALEEMRDYYAVPPTYRRQALAYFTSRVPILIACHANLELLPDGPHPAWGALDNEEWSLRTIFPFLMRRNGAPMALAECTTVYRALNHDLSELLPAHATIEERALGAQLCHVGQPVALREPGGVTTGALRISAGARIVSETWVAGDAVATHRKLDAEPEQVRTILEKIQLILRHFDALHGKC